ncbi:hypothetical protein GCK32_009203, partial [Trichostrongylus colubriformis]
MSDQFQPDLYPPTRGPTPAVSLAEWRAGLDAAPVQLQLRPGQLNTTSKPVRLRGRSGSPKLITSDLNNEMKFRFLSQVTKPDYRSVDEREDCEEIIKLIEVKQKRWPAVLRVIVAVEVPETANKLKGTIISHYSPIIALRKYEGKRLADFGAKSDEEIEEAEEAADAVTELQRALSPAESGKDTRPPSQEDMLTHPDELFTPILVADADVEPPAPISDPIDIRPSSKTRSSLRDSLET